MAGEGQTGSQLVLHQGDADDCERADWLADLDQVFKQRGESVDPDLFPTAVKLARFPYTDTGTLYGLPHIGNLMTGMYVIGAAFSIFYRVQKL